MADDALDVHLRGLNGDRIGVLHADLNVFGIVLDAFRIDVSLFNGKAAGKDGAADVALVGLHLDGLGVRSSIAFTSASSLACSSSERDWSNKVGSRTFGSNGRFFSLIL